jgi:hypothetical protein
LFSKTSANKRRITKRRQNMANILLVDDQPYMGEFLSEELSEPKFMPLKK